MQEGLNNVRKHANAKNVKIIIIASHPYLILRLQDDGVGFKVKDQNSEMCLEKRMGLRSMKERVNFLHGSIKIKSHPGKGTKIFIKIPRREDRWLFG